MKERKKQVNKKGVYEIFAQNMNDLQIVTGFFVPVMPVSLSLVWCERTENPSR